MGEGLRVVCPSCGEERPLGGQYCSVCGSKMPEVRLAGEVTDTRVPTGDCADTEKRGGCLSWWVLFVLVVSVALAIDAWWKAGSVEGIMRGATTFAIFAGIPIVVQAIRTRGNTGGS